MERLKEGGRQIAAGGSAGLVEVCIMHPLDLVKTRLQIGGGHYNGLMDCFRKTLHNEGFRGFYKGILPPILAETPKRATKFFTFAQYKELFASNTMPAWASLSLAGLCSGLTEAVVVCPFETVKVQMQSDRSVKQHHTTFQVGREIVKKQGFGTQGLYRGLDATLARNGVWNMFYFGIYHNIKDFIPSEKERPTANIVYRLGLGFIAGTTACLFNIPFDVAKSRIQGPQPATGRIYHGCIQSMVLVVRQEGILTLWRGLLPKAMRLGPGGAIMLFVYDTVYEFLKENT